MKIDSQIVNSEPLLGTQKWQIILPVKGEINFLNISDLKELSSEDSVFSWTNFGIIVFGFCLIYTCKQWHFWKQNAVFSQQTKIQIFCVSLYLLNYHGWIMLNDQ